MAKNQGDTLTVQHISNTVEGKPVTREMSRTQYNLIGADEATNGGWKVVAPKESK